MRIEHAARPSVEDTSFEAGFGDAFPKRSVATSWNLALIKASEIVAAGTRVATLFQTFFSRRFQ